MAKAAYEAEPCAKCGCRSVGKLIVSGEIVMWICWCCRVNRGPDTEGHAPSKPNARCDVAAPHHHHYGFHALDAWAGPVPWK